MARKRITEEDLLDFRKRAAELSEEVAVKYEALDKARKPVEEEARDIGIIMLCAGDVDIDKMKLFAKNAKANGFAVEVMDIEKHPVPGGKPVKRIPEWEEMMDKSQQGYLMISERCERVVVLGTGCSAPAATLIAEQYPVEALVIVGQGPAAKTFTTRRTVAKLANVARNNLFSVVCPVYCITPEIDNVFRKDAAMLFHTHSRCDNVKLETVEGMSVSAMWTDCEQELEKRIFEYLGNL